jgi:hypothetical protein
MGLGLSLWLGTTIPVLAQVQPSLVGSFATPRNVNAPFQKYRIGLEIGSSPIEQLGIGLPQTIRVNGAIIVQDAKGATIPVRVTYREQRALLTFERPLPTNSGVMVDLNGVKNTLRTTQVLNFPLAAKVAGQSQLVQFDTARIQVKLP